MTMLDLTVHFARFRAAAPERINLAAHSHHDWPDVTFAAQEQCWLDAARLAGDKWDLVFGELIPRVQAGIARQLRLPDPSTISVAPNTHESPILLCGRSAGSHPDTKRYPWIVEAALKNRQKQFIIDGEAVVLGVDGISDFNALHSGKHNDEVQLCAFDVLALDGEDLRKLPL
jgi:hypothetical protein